MLNLKSDETIILSSNLFQWEKSYVPGVDRIKFEREFEESGIATSIVKYSPNTSFSHHTHKGGEEFIVLEGTFHDENGKHERLHYVRNPIGSMHSPYTLHDGCVIFVKLGQMKPEEKSVSIEVKNNSKNTVLFESGLEKVILSNLKKGETLELSDSEVLIISGKAKVRGINIGKYGWCRVSAKDRERMVALEDCIVYTKIGQSNTKNFSK